MWGGTLVLPENTPGMSTGKFADALMVKHTKENGSNSIRKGLRKRGTNPSG
jgi:hypothetical protein